MGNEASQMDPMYMKAGLTKAEVSNPVHRSFFFGSCPVTPIPGTPFPLCPSCFSVCRLDRCEATKSCRRVRVCEGAVSSRVNTDNHDEKRKDGRGRRRERKIESCSSSLLLYSEDNQHGASASSHLSCKTVSESLSSGANSSRYIPFS